MVVVMVACNPGYIITFVNSIVHGAVVIVNFRCEVAVGRTMSKMYNKNKLIDYWSWTSNLVFEWIELTLVRHSTYNSISYLRDRCRVRCVYQPTLHLMDTCELGFTLFKREKKKTEINLWASYASVPMLGWNATGSGRFPHQPERNLKTYIKVKGLIKVIDVVVVLTD